MNTTISLTMGAIMSAVILSTAYNAIIPQVKELASIGDQHTLLVAQTAAMVHGDKAPVDLKEAEKMGYVILPRGKTATEVADDTAARLKAVHEKAQENAVKSIDQLNAVLENYEARISDMTKQIEELQSKIEKQD